MTRSAHTLCRAFSSIDGMKFARSRTFQQNRINSVAVAYDVSPTREQSERYRTWRVRQDSSLAERYSFPSTQSFPLVRSRSFQDCVVLITRVDRQMGRYRER